MPDYSQGKIYKIVNDSNDNFYIGSTIQPLYKRMYHHKNQHHRCMSKNLGVDIKDCIIVLVENIQCKDKDELLRKERFYIEKYRNEGLNIVNKIIPGRTKKEYYEDNKEKIAEQTKKLYEKKKTKRNQQQKENYEKNKEYYIKKHKEYNKKNKETINKYAKEYREKYKQKTKEYYEKNKDIISERKKEKITCECGSTFQKTELSRHKKTKKHIKFLESNN